MLRSFDPTSPSAIGIVELITAAIGSLTIESFSRAGVAVGLVAPRCTRDTDEKKKRGEFHIHIVKLVIHNAAVTTTDWQDTRLKTYLRLK